MPVAFVGELFGGSAIMAGVGLVGLRRRGGCLAEGSEER